MSDARLLLLRHSASHCALAGGQHGLGLAKDFLSNALVFHALPGLRVTFTPAPTAPLPLDPTTPCCTASTLSVVDGKTAKSVSWSVLLDRVVSTTDIKNVEFHGSVESPITAVVTRPEATVAAH